MVLLNKKGRWMFLVRLVLVLIIAAIFLMVFPTMLSDSDEAADRSKCKAEVQVHAVKLAGKGVAPGELTQCNPIEIEFDDKDDEDFIMETMSYEMYSCWNKFGEGELDFISNWDGGKKCYVCTIIDFDKEFQVTNPEIRGFDTYLRDKEFPYFKENKNVSFYEYLYGEHNVEGMPEEFVIDATDTNYIVFFADKTSNFKDIMKGIGLAGGGVALCAGGVYLAVQTAFIGTPAAIKACAVGTGLAITGAAYSTKHHPDFSAGLYVGKAQGVVESCS
jgi:hypothetical protein